MAFFNSSAGSVYYQVQGEGEPLVFVHGRTLDSRMWQPQLECFTKYYKCITYDLNGFGKSAIPSEGYSRGKTLEELLQHLSIRNAHFIGLSLGAHTILELALRKTEYFRTMILLSPAVPGLSYGPEFMNDWHLVEKAGQKGDFEIAKKYWIHCKAFASLKTTDPVNYQLFEKIIADYSCWDIHNGPKSKPIEVDALKDYESIKIPTLLMYGENDYQDFMKNAQALNHSIACSRIIEVANCSHMLNMEYPELINRNIDDFLHSIT